MLILRNDVCDMATVGAALCSAFSETELRRINKHSAVEASCLVGYVFGEFDEPRGRDDLHAIDDDYDPDGRYCIGDSDDD